MKVFACRSALCRLGYKPYVTEGRQTKRSSLIIHEFVRRRRRRSTVLLYRYTHASEISIDHEDD